jgi:hypothetical protein
LIEGWETTRANAADRQRGEETARKEGRRERGKEVGCRETEVKQLAKEASDGLVVDR